MKRLVRIFVWSTAVTLTVLAGWLAQRRESVCDFIAVVTAGRLHLIVARDGNVVVTLSNYRVSSMTPSGIHIDKTSPWLLTFDRGLFAARSEFAIAGFRGCVGDRVVGQNMIAHVLEVELPQWTLALPLVILIAKWYRRVCVRSARIDAGHCIACGYNLRGSQADRCSECGTLALRPSAS